MAECKKCERQKMIQLYVVSIVQSIYGLCSFKQGRPGMIGERRRRNDIEEIIFRWLPESCKETGEVQCITRECKSPSNANTSSGLSIVSVGIFA